MQNYCSTRLQVVDEIPPVLQCEETIVLYANEQCKARIPLVTPNVTENCPSVTFTQSVDRDSLIEIETQINVTVTDGSENEV